MKFSTRILTCILFLLLLFFMGCSAKKKPQEIQKYSDYEKWRKLAEYTQAHSPTPRKIDKEQYQQQSRQQQIQEAQARAAVPKKKKQPPRRDRRLPTTPVSLQMHEVDVGLLFRTLAKAADVNLILNKSITGTASLNIKNVPWDQVFRGLLNAHGYTYVWMEDIIRVVSIEDIKAQATLREARQEMELKNQEHDIALMTLKTEKANLEPLMTRTVHVDYADPKQLRDNLWEYLKNLKGQNEQKPKNTDEPPKEPEIRGAILVDAHTNSLIIQATPTDMVGLLELMEKLDKPTPQILIEAYIVETTGDTARELGMQWGGLGLNQSTSKNLWAGGPIGTFDSSLFVGEDDATADSPAGSSITHMPIVGNILNFPSSDSAGTSGWQGAALSLMMEKVGNYILYAQLTALQEKGKLNILSKPSITTLDNQRAVIESGREIPFTASNDGENTVQFKKAVLKLEATPHVIDGRYLKIKIITNKDELDFSNSVDGNPVILTKFAETEVVLLDGQTTVIGGLGKQTRSETESGLPGLMDIPVVGNAFKQQGRSSEMEDVLIFITPYILKPRIPEKQAAGTDPLTPANTQTPEGGTDMSEPSVELPAPSVRSEQEIQQQLHSPDPEYRFSLQAGVFGNQQNAKRLLKRLTAKGYSPYIFEVLTSKQKKLYCVRIQNFYNLKSATIAARKFHKKENAVAVVTFYNMLDMIPQEIGRR